MVVPTAAAVRRHASTEASTKTHTPHARRSTRNTKISHVPIQPARIPSPRSMPSRDKLLPLDTRNMSEPQGNVVWQSTLHVRFITYTLSKKEVQGHLSQEVKNELGARLQCRCLQEGRQP